MHIQNKLFVFLMIYKTKPHSTSLSWDHTFKSAEMVKLDGDNQFAANFIMVNENGYVVTYCPVKTLSIKSELKPLLMEHARRHKIDTVYTDLCCEQGNLIHEVFGPDCRVKLDIHHFDDRLNRTLKDTNFTVTQKEAFKYMVMMITRQEGDSEFVRTKPTASSEEILKNLTKAHTYWEKIGLPKSMKKAFKLAYKHTSKCLNDIPVGLGTQVNEGIHSSLNAFFHGRKILSAEVFEVWIVIYQKF